MNRLYSAYSRSITITTTPNPPMESGSNGLGMNATIDWGLSEGLQASKERFLAQVMGWSAGDLVFDVLNDLPLDEIARSHDPLTLRHSLFIPSGTLPSGLFNFKPKPRSGRDRSKPVPQ
ncbi:hypothetical protein [Spirulina subsalsa]|uniref:hypothetical protein n=1 Tax=Spirulina subsalsa TaxID=54311 RepID=UPI00030D1186|nr:hypothetical protein [Spirulina subsalsa]